MVTFSHRTIELLKEYGWGHLLTGLTEISFGIARYAFGTLSLRSLQSCGIDILLIEFLKLALSKSHHAKK